MDSPMALSVSPDPSERPTLKDVTGPLTPGQGMVRHVGRLETLGRRGPTNVETFLYSFGPIYQTSVSPPPPVDTISSLTTTPHLSRVCLLQTPVPPFPVPSSL